MKRLAIIVAAAALALTPAAATAKKPVKSQERAGKAERKHGKQPAAERRCRQERAELGAAAFAAKYGKARTKGSAKAKAKAARAAFGRCVSQAARALRAEREAAEDDDDEDELDLEDDGTGEDEEQAEDEAGGLGRDHFDEEPGVETPEPDDGQTLVDLEEGREAPDPDEDGPGLGLGGEPHLG